MKLPYRFLPSILLFPLAAVASCGTADDGDGDTDINLPSCAEDDRDDTYVAGFSEQGPAEYTVALMDSNPAPPSKGDNIWSVELTDPQGAPAAGLDVKVSAYMPDHGHYTNVKAVVTDDGNGAYTLDPVNLFMPGYWEITLDVVDPGASEENSDDVELDSLTFKFCVEG